MNNSYQRIKSHVFGNLQKLSSPLPDDQIKKEIETCRTLIKLIGLINFAMVLPQKTELIELSEVDWGRMERELETQFDVKMEFGILIQGDSAANRDSHWWSSKQKQAKENYYWDRYKSYLSNSLNDGVIKTIDKDTDIIMDNLENPDEASFSRYGMVVGHVQSGKTGNYSALVCKAADAGYKFIVVIAGGMNNLRDQTQVRLNEYFVGQDMGQQVGAGIGTIDKKKLPISLTTKEKDFNKQDADKNSQSLNFDNINAPILLVIKKNTKTLANVIHWLQKQYKNKINHSMLLIDDESDYASINTKEEEDPTTINKRIRTLISLFNKSVYVAYTATPYANIFIDHHVGHDELGKDLFPKDFIYALDAPTNYFGARKIFLDASRKNLIPIKDYLEAFPTTPPHKKDWFVPALPDSLNDAIRHFVLNISVRYLRGQASEHNSMLVHASRFTNVHQRTATLIENYLDRMKSEVRVFGMLPDASTQSSIIADIEGTFEDRLKGLEFSWKETLNALTKIISNVVVREVHQSTSVPLIYRKDMSTNAIVVGGTSLSRGYTLEGLSISYFLRNTIFYDTLMQMGRWFGYRPGYEDICKIYLPEASIDSFGQIIEATEDLIDDLKRMKEANMTPNDFGLAVKHHPDSGLQVTARNKQKNAKDIYFDMKLDGHAKETSWLHINQKKSEANTKVITEFIRKINFDHQLIRKGNNFLWSNIDKNEVVNFFNSYEVYGAEDELGFRSRMPIKFILKYAQEVNTKWDISVHSGSGHPFPIIPDSVIIKKQTRKLIDKGEYLEVPNRKVSTGSAELISLDEKETKELGNNPKPKEIRAKMSKPLLMLHILQNDDDGESTYPAFGVSFPGGINSGTEKTIKLKINTVYLDSIKDMFEEDYDD